MKFVASLAFSPLDHYCDIARAAEAAGFDALALSDHVVHPERIDSPYPYTENHKPRWEPFTPWPDPWVAIGAMAAVTTRLRFFTSVYVLPMRNPFQVAKIVATAAVLSNNRIALGVGAGWMEEEFELLEQPFRQRGKRMDEMLEVMRTLWAGGMVEHHGEFYDFDRLEMSPVPSRPIPVYVGGLSKPALRRAARNDGWLSDLHSTAELKEIVAQLRALREESDRADNPFHVLASATDAFDIDGYRRLEDVGVTHLVTMPWVFYGGRLDSLDSKRDGIRRFGEEIIARA
jgi:probable F420-dependent oxidoreductase